jgi:hypothetical protein
LGFLGPAVTQDLELHEPVDVLGRKRRLEELDAELFHAVRGNRDHEAIRLRGDGLCSGGTGGTLVEAQTPVNMYLFGF